MRCACLTSKHTSNILSVMAIEQHIIERIHEAIIARDDEQKDLAVELYKFYLSIVERGFRDIKLFGEISSSTYTFSRNIRRVQGENALVVDGKETMLTNLEEKLFRLLEENANSILSRAQISEHLYGDTNSRSNDALQQIVKRLRGKIEVDPKNPRSLVVIGGKGYMFRSLEK